MPYSSEFYGDVLQSHVVLPAFDGKHAGCYTRTVLGVGGGGS